MHFTCAHVPEILGSIFSYNIKRFSHELPDKTGSSSVSGMCVLSKTWRCSMAIDSVSDCSDHAVNETERTESVQQDIPSSPPEAPKSPKPLRSSTKARRSFWKTDRLC